MYLIVYVILRLKSANMPYYNTCNTTVNCCSSYHNAFVAFHVLLVLQIKEEGFACQLDVAVTVGNELVRSSHCKRNVHNTPT